MADQPLWERVVAGHFVLAKRSFWPNFFSRIVARLQWSPEAIDLSGDASAWAELPDERRERLTAMLAGFCVAEDAVAQQLTPFADVARNGKLLSQESLMAWVFFLQRRDEQRHARLFDRIGAEVLGLAGDTPDDRRAAAREHVTPAMLELFEERLPAMAAELAEGRAGLDEGVSLYHMLLEGVVFDAGQHALLDDLEDGALPGIRRASSASSATSAGTSASACAAWSRPSLRPSSWPGCWSARRPRRRSGATPSPSPRARRAPARSGTGSTPRA